MVIISHQRSSVAEERRREGEPEAGGGKLRGKGRAGGGGGTLVVRAHPAAVKVFGVHYDIGRALKQTSTFSEHWTCFSQSAGFWGTYQIIRLSMTDGPTLCMYRGKQCRGAHARGSSKKVYQ